MEYSKSRVRKGGKRTRVDSQCLITNKKMLKTQNQFSIIDNFSEVEIEKLLNGDGDESKPQKKKCPFCGFKTACHADKWKCNASGATCNYCLKPEHLPKYQRCSKKRKEKFMMKKNSKKTEAGL